MMSRKSLHCPSVLSLCCFCSGDKLGYTQTAMHIGYYEHGEFGVLISLLIFYPSKYMFGI